ncbi:MAG: nucleotide exchange factor GrpE [Thermoleophilia bacterium]
MSGPGQAADLAARVEELEGGLQGALRKLDEVEAERQTFLNDLQRVAAEFDNFRKRSVRDREALVARATEQLVRELLPVLDDLERALEHGARHEGDKLTEGVALVHRQLDAILRKEGLTEIEASGQFDPHVHEALLSQPSEEDEGTILQIVQKGYRLGDVVVRPARVVVAAAPPDGGSEG